MMVKRLSRNRHSFVNINRWKNICQEEIEKERADWNRERKELREYEKEIKKKMAELDEKEVRNSTSYSSY